MALVMEDTMDLIFTWKRFEELSTLELYRILAAREAIFVVEQSCPYQDADGLDVNSWHLSVSVNGELAAYARLVEPGLKFAEPSIGRVITLADFRGKKIGHALMSEAIAFTEKTFPEQGIRIGAQAHLQKFYGSLGFEPASEVYDEDGIAHIDMVKPAVITAAVATDCAAPSSNQSALGQS